MILAAALVVMQERVIVDCDPGKFTDDNAAITMLARSGKVKIEAVTTVAGNVWANEGAANIRATLAMLHVKAPVYLGSQRPLVHTAEMSKKQGPIEFFGAFATPQPPVEKETAVDFLTRRLKKGPATILAIGPLTNIARLLERRPDLASRIERLVIMGGNVYVAGNASKAAEFNFWFDPEAAQRVLRSAIPNKILFPLDICNKVVVTPAHFDQIVAHKGPVVEAYRESFGNDFPGFLKNPLATAYLWDELAAAWLIDPSFVTKSEDLYLDVETQFGPRYGAVKTSESGASKTKVMLEADPGKPLQMYVTLLK